MLVEYGDRAEWEVVMFGTPNTLLWSFQHSSDALTLYNASIKGGAA